MGTTLTIAESFVCGGGFNVGAGSFVAISADDLSPLSGAATLAAAGDSDGETINFGVSLDYAIAFSAGAGGTLNLAGGLLTLSGATDSIGGATIARARPLDLDGTTTIAGGLMIGGTGELIGNDRRRQGLLASSRTQRTPRARSPSATRERTAP